MLVKERSHLEAAVKDLELKFVALQEDVTKLSTLKYVYNSLLEKIQRLQVLLDYAAKQADQGVLVLHQKQELHKKVDRLEESVAVANVYKLSSEKMQ